MNELDKLRYEGAEVGVSFFSFEVTGPDAESFLHGQTTNNSEKLEVKNFQLDTLLDISGRVLTYFWVLKKNKEHFILLFESDELTHIALERLEKYHIAEDLELGPVSKKDVVLTFDPRSKFKSEKDEYRGNYFGETCSLVFDSYPKMHEDFLEALKKLRGFDASSSLLKLITDSVLFELALDLKKGCYLGQETVGKIASRRGAAFYPMALKLDEAIQVSEAKKLSVDAKKIGTVLSSFKIGDDNYLLTSLLRDYRVEDYKFQAEIDGKKVTLIAKSFPLIKYNKIDKAQELFDNAVDLFQKDREEEAIYLLKLAVEIDPSFEDAYESLGVIYGRHEKFEEAIKLMQKLSQVNPKSVMAHTNMSLYYMKLGDIETAEKHKSEATIKTFEFYGDEAKRKEETKKREEEKLIERNRRESMFKEVLEIDSEDSLALFGLSDIEYEKGNVEIALGFAQRVLSSNPKYSVAYLLLGKILTSLGKKDEAKEKLQEGIKIASSQGELMPANEMQRLLSRL